MLNLAKKHSIHYMRFGLEPSENYNMVAFVLNLLRRLNKKAFLRSGMTSSDFMINWDWIEKYDFTQYVSSVAANKTTEIIFHPERPEEFALLRQILLSEDGLSQERLSRST
jgi:ABC-type antimicrobial peptide transport system ATPase subunit